jgi:hypothetical protein
MNDDVISKDTKTTVYYLSYGGLIPFIAALFGFFLLDEPIRSFSLNAFITYAAVIIGFVGAVHWGFLLKADDIGNKNLLLSLSVLPGLIGWCALLLNQQLALIIFALMYPSVFIYEKLTSLKNILPDWYMPMRLKLTYSVTSMLLVMILGQYI